MRLTKIVQELLAINDDLTNRTYGNVDNDVAGIYMFPQIWSSTALGFGGIGGQAITEAMTYIVDPDYNSPLYVYFAGEFAYAVKEPNDAFREDVRKHCMASVAESGRYKK